MVLAESVGPEAVGRRAGGFRRFLKSNKKYISRVCSEIFYKNAHCYGISMKIQVSKSRPSTIVVLFIIMSVIFFACSSGVAVNGKNLLPLNIFQ